MATLLTWDGYRVTRSRQPLLPEYLNDIQVLVVGNAMPYPRAFERLAKVVKLDRGAVFDAEEVEAVRRWVEGGGSLLLEATAPGAVQADAPLAEAFGLSFHECPTPIYSVVDGPPGSGETAAVLSGAWVHSDRAITPLLTGREAVPCIARKPVAVALAFGRGRVVALSAQVERDENRVRETGVDPRVMDNRRFVLHTMHWLSRAD